MNAGVEDSDAFKNATNTVASALTPCRADANSSIGSAHMPLSSAEWSMDTVNLSIKSMNLSSGSMNSSLDFTDLSVGYADSFGDVTNPCASVLNQGVDLALEVLSRTNGCMDDATGSTGSTI